VSDPKKHERRRRELKLRRAAAQREFDREEADELFHFARQNYRSGDAPAAARGLKKALALCPDHPKTLELLGQIYFEAGHYADAAYYLGLLRKQAGNNPGVLFNLATAHANLGRQPEALADFRKFLELTKFFPEPKWAPLRQNAAAWMKQLSQSQQKPLPRVPQAGLAEPKAEPLAAPPPPQPRSVSVDFPPSLTPDFQREKAGTLGDYFLRRGFLQLKLAQNFEDLICLSSLTGVDSYVYQHETVRKVLRHFKGRALLADEVGLGKTIEACLVLKEYWSRGMVHKALVLTPPSLAPQWIGELTEKFGFTPASPDSPEFRRDPLQFWKQQTLVVASIAMARLEPHASALAATPWDLVIVDEAHCLKNRSSANWKLVNSLQKKFILMLTATPVENNLIELYNLITVLKPGLLATESEFRKLFVTPGRPKTPKDPERLHNLLAEVMVRNTRAAVDVRLPPRVAASVTVPPSPAEAQLYEMVSAFVAQHYRPREGDGRSRLALSWLQRQAGSSPQALCRAISRTLAQDNGFPPSERRELERILELASTISSSGKGLRLGQMLAARPGKVVVFTEFIPTLESLAQVCGRHGVPCALFSGELSKAEKDAAIARFRDEVDVLLSTGVGGEGRNLQFASTVINFDLPWNPMRLEQRVGRVHRIGQSREVFVFNFCQAGTVEEQLLRVLHEKINMFELVVGEMDIILGALDESGDFADLVLELWLSARQAGRVEQAFDELAERLLDAKKQYARTKQLDETLFHRDFEV
jgi:SNF2 family DNA or RNA helicase